ncbi:MAG: NIPSNAP family protein [Rufibacter sp.]
MALYLVLSVTAAAAPKREFYQLKIYHLKDQAQEDQLDQFLKNAYLPALHRAGVNKVGVFKPADVQVPKAPPITEKLVYVFIPYQSVEQIFKVEESLLKDKSFASAGKNHLNAPFDHPPYQRLEVILMQAFAGKSTFSVPVLNAPSADRIYELRSYESATDHLHQNKVDMFNKGEIEIFDRLGFNAVFYGQVKAGNRMPNLMYMTTFENRAERDKKWKEFSADPAWQKLRVLPEYANNVQHIDILLLQPTSYSEI